MPHFGMAADADLVPIWIVEVGTVVVGMIVRAQPRCSVVGCSMGQSPFVSAINTRSVTGEERNHLAVPRARVIAVERAADQKKWAINTVFHPSGPLCLWSTKFENEAQLAHYARVESVSTVKVRDSEMHVRQKHDAVHCRFCVPAWSPARYGRTRGRGGRMAVRGQLATHCGYSRPPVAVAATTE